ncbi:RodZ domain-containing protein [Limibacillus sp. MBR-115]|jgi:cytoskeleton protein RodZ|uniref:helix-turn-helix domain-containing protein n=1 Tax=Limibacillus sp. MBR-115 TaxID=3156465 RepID=UPI0033936255
MSNLDDEFEQHQLDDEALPEVRPTVGRLLRETRESYELDQQDVAGALRIRSVYVAAMEEGRYDDLPGEAYAIGFVRTYADYLRLDSAEVVKRFKAEFAGLERRSLRFPTPPREGHIPGGALILIALVLIALGYGAWSYFGQEERSFADSVEAVPEELKPLVDPVPEVQSDPTINTQSQSEMRVEPNAGPRLEQQPAAETAMTPEVPSLVEIPTPTDLPEQAPQDALPAPAEQPAGSVTEETSAAGSALPLAQSPAPEPSSDVAVAPPPIPAQSLQNTTADSEGRTLGATDVASRVVLVASSDAWVQIREADGSLLMTRILQAGDRYRVPDRPGLLLDVGNAGGVTVELDGATLSPLGDLGRVLRKISLDPEALRNRLAQ